jgi:hypothetical protein
MRKLELETILKYWAADREAVPSTGIIAVEFDYDAGWPGSDVTPPEWPEIIVKYTVSKSVVYRVRVNELGGFIGELADVSSRIKPGL